MNLPGVIAIFFVGVIIASCSEKSDADRSPPSQAEKLKRTPEAARANESEAQRSSRLEVKSEEAGEKELQPPDDEIAEDCVAFLRSTKTVSVTKANDDCPQCPVNSEASEVLKFRDIRVDRVARSESACEVKVTIHATFNPSTHEGIAGGLTAWISPEQKAQYLQGKIPPDQQVYQVKITYRRDGQVWQAVEFDRP